MFLSKIWLFLVTLGAAVALTIALVMPRPAQRQLVNEEHNRLAVACGVINILLADDARNRVELAGSFSRAPEIVSGLESASAADRIDEQRMKALREAGENVMKGIQGRKPDFAMLIDRKGRVVARVKVDEGDFGDVFSGRPLVDDALAGYLRDDLWIQGGTLYFVAASPVIKRDPPVSYAGAVVLGHKVTSELAQKLVSSLNVDIGFYMPDKDVVSSRTIALDHAPMNKAIEALKAGELSKDCQANHPIDLHAGSEDFTALVARLPGEAALQQAYYTVLIKRPEARGFMGTLSVVRQNDLSLSNFPWAIVGAVFLLALGVGIAFMWIEGDRPLRRLAADALLLANNKKERLNEDQPGKFGSTARSVNIFIDKLGREAKSARTNLDQLLGPAPEGSLGTIDLLSGALPPIRPGGPAPAVAPPPSDFRFNDPLPPAPPPVTMRAPTAPPRHPTPPPIAPPAPPRAAAPPVPPPIQSMKSAPLDLSDDILGDKPTAIGAPTVDPGIDPYFKQVFDQFVAVKKSCNEPTSGLTYAKFSEKLVKNRDDLIAKTGCREVRFTVYVKDGKAALKATPVKDGQ